MENQYAFGSYGYIAKKNLNSAERILGIDADIVLYCSHQAVEKILKENLQRTYFQPDVLKLLQTHKLYVLVRKSRIAELSSFSVAIAGLDNYYVDGRYPGVGYADATNEEAKRHFLSAKQIVAILENKISEVMSNGIHCDRQEVCRKIERP